MRRSLNAQACRRCGFSLLELLVVLAILSILLTQAVPAVSQRLVDLRLQATARDLYAVVMFARLLSQRNANTIIFCPNAGGSALCPHLASGSDENPDVTIRNAEGKVLKTLFLRDGVTLRNRAGTQGITLPLVWGADGLGSRNATLSVCSPRYPDLNWSLVINRIGRPRLVRGWGRCSM